MTESLHNFKALHFFKIYAIYTPKPNPSLLTPIVITTGSLPPDLVGVVKDVIGAREASTPRLRHRLATRLCSPSTDGPLLHTAINLNLDDLLPVFSPPL